MATDKTMRDKVVMVTGAGRGIGREVALLMAAEGARVVVNDVGGSLAGKGSDAGPANQVVAEISGRGGEAVANTDSVVERAGTEHIVRTALDTFGRIDCVVNSAGILRDEIFHKMSHEDWEAVIGVHLMGSFNVSRAAAPHFRAQTSGTFVHFTSNAGLVGAIGQANYAAAKMGIVGLSGSIALEMERFNVRSNCVAPFAWSRMIEAIPTHTPEQRARVERIKPMTAAHIAPLVVFLASDAAEEVSGQIFTVRRNEVILMSQPRPLRSVHRSEGWTPVTLAKHMLPALRQSFCPLEVSNQVFPWDPI